MPTGRTIVFLSDFGYRNEWVGICHAVMNRIAPASPIVDLSHGIPPLDVRGGAVLLVDSLPYLAADAVVLAIVDPSVGRDRDIALEAADGRLIVGPDNGLLAPAASALGGVARAVEITSPEVVLTAISPSFHARDVLAPAAAHLAAGAELATLGVAVEPATLAELTIPEPTVERGKIECEVLDLNRFGNVLLNVRESQLAEAGPRRRRRDPGRRDLGDRAGPPDRDLCRRRLRRLGPHRRPARLAERRPRQPCERGGGTRERRAR